MNVSDEGLRPDENLRVFLPTIDSRNIGLDGVRSYRFIMLYYVDCRIGRLKAFAKDGIERHPCILCGDLESLLDDDNFRMNTGMVDTAPLIIWLLYFALMMNFHVFE
jgi:hypothetical protein